MLATVSEIFVNPWLTDEPFRLGTGKMALPPPGPGQAYCDVSALESGVLGLPLSMFVTNPSLQGTTSITPSLSFLIKHSSDKGTFLFDLGIRKDWERLPPSTVEWTRAHFKHLQVEQDVVESLAKGGLSTSDIDTVCLSHIHFDHIGHPKLFPKSTFLLGGAAKYRIDDGYPGNPDSGVASDLLPGDRTQWLSPDKWEAIGPFPRALDFYGDGSLYIVDAPGHIDGHLNILVRTSPDGGWLLLAGDSAHHWELITGESKIAVDIPGWGVGCSHQYKEAAEEQIGRIRDLMKQPRVRVLLSHDEPWYRENKGGSAFWPGKIPSL